MDNRKNDKYYINKVIENIDYITKYTNNLSYDEYSDNDLIIDAVVFRLVQMVENINHISKEYKDSHPDIEWGLIVGFRNGIVHDYGKTDYTIVYEIVTEDITRLRNLLVKETQFFHHIGLIKCLYLCLYNT